MIRVLHLLDALERGGRETLVSDFSRSASRHGIDAAVVSMGSGELQTSFQLLGDRYASLTRRFPIDPVILLRLRKVVKDRNIQIIHAHQAVEGLHAYFACKGLQDVKVVLSFHGHTSSQKNELALRYLVPRMNANIAVSAAFLAKLREKAQYYRDHTFYVVYNGVDLRKLTGTSGSVRAELGLRPNESLVGMVSNFVPGKDPVTVCRAMAILHDRKPDLHFVFVGARSPASPAIFQRCHDLCSSLGLTNNVHFLGKRGDIDKVLSSLDAFVFSSTDDSFGIAPVEAMIAGVPVVLSDIPTLREICLDGEHGFLFKVGDPEELALKMCYVIEHNVDCKKAALDTSRWARRIYSIDKHISECKQIYEKLICAT